MMRIYNFILLGLPQAQKVRFLSAFAYSEFKTATHLSQERYLLLSSFTGALCGLLIRNAACIMLLSLWTVPSQTPRHFF